MRSAAFRRSVPDRLAVTANKAGLALGVAGVSGLRLLFSDRFRQFQQVPGRSSLSLGDGQNSLAQV